MKKLLYTTSAAILVSSTILLSSSTYADETSNDFKYASSIKYFYRAASITSFKDYRDVKKEAEAAKKAEEEKKAEADKRAAEEAAKKAEEEKKAAEEHKAAESSQSSVVQTSTERLYSLSDFMFRGVVYWNDYKFTYYSQSVLPGGGLSIPGRHVNADGYVSDGDGYIVLAGSAPLGTVYDTPFGYQGKIYDRGTSGNHLDVYIQ